MRYISLRWLTAAIRLLSSLSPSSLHFLLMLLMIFFIADGC